MNTAKELSMYYFLIGGVWAISAAIRIYVHMKYERDDAPRLCGYHAASELRPGSTAIIDGKRCDHCAEEPEYHL